jgi:cytochrome P450
MELFSEETRRNPYPLYARMRSVAPVLHEPAADLWVLLDYAAVKRALTDHETFSSRASASGGQPLDWLIFLDPPRHTKLRAIVMRAFTPTVIAGLEPRVRELSGELLDARIADGVMDLAQDFAIPLPLMVIAEMLGIPPGDRPRFRRWSDVIMRLSETVAGGEGAAQAVADFRAATVEMKTYLRDSLAARRAAPRDDLLTRLVMAEVDGERLDEDEITGFFQLLLVAGSETTTNLIGNAVLALTEHPESLARVRTTPALLPSAIEEVLRHRAPVQAMFRQTRRDVEVDGRTIPSGKLVLAMIGAANRDPAQFPDPDRFDVARDPNPHVAFGHGVHFCLGAALSRLEGRIALGDVLSRLGDLEVAGPWEPRKAFHVHGPTRLPIRFRPASRRAGT